MLVQIKKGTLYYGVNDVFENIDFSVNENEKIGLIGRNGSGKTSLLRIIANKEKLSNGDVFKNSKANIAYLKQNALSNSENTLKEEFDEVFKELIAKEKILEDLTKQMQENHSDEIVSKYFKVHDEFEKDGGYIYQSEIKTILFGFGFKECDLERKISSFSGGEKTKIAFGKLLLSKPQLLLLDEPTNHLDLNTIRWLESYLASYSNALIIVSHDRVFLDKTTNVTYELEYGGITRYAGNYSFFVNQKKKNQELQAKLYAYQQKDIKRLETLIEKFRYKTNKAKFAQSKIKYLDRMGKIEAPGKSDTKTFNANFTSKIKGGKNVLSFDRFKVGYEKPFFEITLDIQKGDRLCIMGDNGSGKSTLLKTIIGEIKELGGYKLFGHQIDYSYFDQNLANFKNNKTVMDELWDDYPNLTIYQVRSVLGAFCFTSDDVFKDVSCLSGGEKVRLMLAKIMMEHKNLLILDEPTNHLDILSKEALEDALKDYDGTIIFVSHDRYFISKIATKCLVIENNETKLYEDGYQDIIDLKPKKSSKVNEEIVIVKEKPKKNKPKYDLKKLENEITELELLLEDKRALRFEPEYYQDQNEMNKLNDEIDDLVNKYSNVLKKWEEAMEENEG